MKVLVIGSKGFIGSHLIQYYRQQADTYVWGCDVVVDYVDKNYYLIDASNADFKTAFQEKKFDVCINCSGAASVPASIQNPSRDYQLNVVNVFNLLDAIRTYQPDCKFLNLSSAAVYGNPQSLPIAEDHIPNPISPYGWHKLQSELICKEFNQNFNIATCSLRIFSAFGEGLQKQLFWDWYQKTLMSSHIKIYGTGKESRDFIFIEDLIQAIVCVVNKGDFDGGIYNIGNGKEISILNVIQVFVSKYSAVQLTYEFTNEFLAGTPVNWQADISKLEALGYKQQITFDKGVEKIIKWLQKEKK